MSKKQLSRRMDKRVLLAKVASPALLVTLSGCITFRPYVEPFDVQNPTHICGIDAGDQDAKSQSNQKSGQDTKTQGNQKSGDAFTYAVKKEKELIDRANTSATIQSATALALIPAAAFLGYRAAFSPNARVLGGLAAGGATAYAGASIAASPTVRKLYLTGAQAISCAIGVTAPYRIPNELTSLDADASKFMADIESDEHWLKGEYSHDVTVKVNDMQARLADAHLAIKQMFPGAAKAELGLCTTTNQILSAMNSQLDAALPDLRPIASAFDRSSTAGIISSPAALSKSSVPLPAATPAAMIDTRASLAGDSRTDVAGKMHDMMSVAEKKVNELVDKVNGTDPAAVQGISGLQGCIDAQIPVVPPPKMTSSSPGVLAQKVTITGTKGAWIFSVTGGKPQYFVDITPASAASMLTVSQSGSGSLVQFKVGAIASAKLPIEATVSVYDSVGNRFTPIELSVNP